MGKAGWRIKGRGKAGGAARTTWRALNGEKWSEPRQATGEFKLSQCPETCRFDGIKAQIAAAVHREPTDKDFDDESKESWLKYIDTEAPMGEAMAEVHRQILLQRAVRAVRPEEGWESLIPEHYHDFGDVFSKKASERMPTRKPYDHAIELVDGATLPPPAKNYSLSHQERNSLDEWIKENLQKGYICRKILKHP